MPDQIFLYIALGIYFAAMLLIGFVAYRRTKGHEGYMLADRGLPPWVAALSAGASDMSGWLIMGLPGAIYAAGLEAWIAIGLTIGAYLNWMVVAPRLRAYTEVSHNSITLPSFFENRLRDRSRLLRIVSAIIILVFFTLYVSSGMVAGGTFFESAFNGDYVWGMILVTVVTLGYTLFGGFLGASLTDVVQGIMMVVALIIVPIVAVIAVGGWGEAVTLISNSTQTTSACSVVKASLRSQSSVSPQVSPGDLATSASHTLWSASWHCGNQQMRKAHAALASPGRSCHSLAPSSLA